MAYKLKLTKEQYEEIVRLYKKCGWSVRQLESRFGIPKTTIHRIVKEGTSYEIIDTSSSK
jgi:DNA invertase Pin-like site-specific DNA recombinase